jgi:hypothetical protein
MAAHIGQAQDRRPAGRPSRWLRRRGGLDIAGFTKHAWQSEPHSPGKNAMCTRWDTLHPAPWSSQRGLRRLRPAEDPRARHGSRGGEHSWESPVLAHQSGQCPRDAGQAGGGGGQGLCQVSAAMKHELCHRSGRQRYMASVTRCHVHPLTSCVMIAPSH